MQVIIQHLGIPKKKLEGFQEDYQRDIIFWGEFRRKLLPDAE
jgi:hypothetical protein